MIFSKALSPEFTPPTPIIDILSCNFFLNFLIKFVDRSFIGNPDNPPFSFLFVSRSFSLFWSVVFDKINPSILYFKINSEIEFTFFSLISGDIFITIGT